MYFWNINQLKNDIVNDKFKEKDRFIYMFIYIILTTIFMDTGSLTVIEEPNIIDKVSAMIGILSTTIGTYYVYQKNGGENGIDFLGRYFSLIWVVSIRLLVFMMITVFIMSFIAGFLGLDEIIVEYMFLGIFFIYMIGIYGVSGQHIGDIKMRITTV